jgi:hypothetical protein
MTDMPSIISDEPVVDKEGVTFDATRKGINRVRTKRNDPRESTRSPLNVATGSRFNVPEAVTASDPEHQYGFIAYSSGAEILQNTVDVAVEKGWWPVKRSEHPSLAQRYFNVNGDDDKADYVRKGGQILMKRLKEDHIAEQEAFRQQAEAQRSSYLNAQTHSHITPAHAGFGAAGNFNQVNFGGY